MQESIPAKVDAVVEDSPPGGRAKVLYLCMVCDVRGGGGEAGVWFVGGLRGLAPRLLLGCGGGGVRVDAPRVSLRRRHRILWGRGGGGGSSECNNR